MRIGGRAGCEEDVVILQWDTERLGDWAQTWQMEFNVDKCEVTGTCELGAEGGNAVWSEQSKGILLSKWREIAGE